MLSSENFLASQKIESIVTTMFPFLLGIAITAAQSTNAPLFVCETTGWKDDSWTIPRYAWRDASNILATDQEGSFLLDVTYGKKMRRPGLYPTSSPDLTKHIVQSQTDKSIRWDIVSTSGKVTSTLIENVPFANMNRGDITFTASTQWSPDSKYVTIAQNRYVDDGYEIIIKKIDVDKNCIVDYPIHRSKELQDVLILGDKAISVGQVENGDDHIKVISWNLNAPTTTLKRWFVMFPQGLYPNDGNWKISPSGKYIAWIFGKRHFAKSNHEFVPDWTSGTAPFTVMISSIEGRQFRQIAIIPSSTGSRPGGLEWSPDEKQVSFIDGHKLYRVPVARP